MYTKRVNKYIVFAICVVVSIVSYTLFIRNENVKELYLRLESPATIFNGAYDICEENVGVKNGVGDTEINIRFSDENIGYDEKYISLNEEGHIVRNFNSYYVKTPTVPQWESKEEQKTIWNLCRYDGGKTIELLDKNNEVVGTITYSLSEKDLLGRQEIIYTWTNEEGTIPIYKAMNSSYSFGTSYLESKYCSGVIE